MPRTEKDIQRDLYKINELEFAIATRLKINLKPVHDDKDEKKVPLTQENIERRIKEMALEFTGNCAVSNPLLITVKGAAPFASLFMRELAELNFPFQAVSISAATMHDSKIEFGGRFLFFLITQGEIYSELIKEFSPRGPTGMEFITLLDEPKQDESAVKASLVGFVVSNHKSEKVGMGLDYNGSLDSLPYIGELDPKLLPTAEEQAILARKKELNIELQECIAGKSPQNVLTVAARAGLRKNSHFGSGALKTSVPEPDSIVPTIQFAEV